MVSSEPHAAAAQPPARSLERQVRGGAMWSAANTLGLKVGNIAIMAVVVRLVTPQEFGVFMAALTVATILGSIADWGVSASLMRAEIDPDSTAPTVAFVSLFTGITLAVVMMLGAPLFAAAFAAPEAVGPIRVISAGLVFGALAAVPTALLNREFRQSRIFVSNLAAFVPANAVLLVLALDGAGTMSFAWSRLVAGAAEALGVTLLVGRFYWPRLDRKAARAVLAFGLPLAAANLVNYTLLNVDYAFIGHALGPRRLGFYVLAFNISSWSTSVVSAAIVGVAMPAFSRVRGDVERPRGAMLRSTRAVCLVALPVSGLTLALAEPLIRTVYGSQWGPSVAILRVLAVYGAAFVLVALMSNFMVGSGRPGRVLGIQVAWIVCLVPAMAIGAHVAGAGGVAWAHVVVVGLVVLPLYVRGGSRLSRGLLRTMVVAAFPAVLATVAASAAAYAAADLLEHPVLKLLVGGTVGGVLYLLLVLPMAASYLPPDEFGPIGRALHRLLHAYARLPRRRAAPLSRTGAS